MNSTYVIGDRVTSGFLGTIPLLAFALGCAAGGVIVGFGLSVVLGAVSWIPPGVFRVLGFAIAGTALITHVIRGTDRLPQRHSQISQGVFSDSLPLGILWFGVQYGTGCRTYVTSSTPFVAIGAVLVVSPHWSTTVLVGGIFGVARSVAVIVRYVAGLPNWSDVVDSQQGALATVPALAGVTLLGFLV